ncbi:hypothetical protein ALC62_13098, partial [Cyphomyrmex costatus]
TLLHEKLRVGIERVDAGRGDRSKKTRLLFACRHPDAMVGKDGARGEWERAMCRALGFCLVMVPRRRRRWFVRRAD